MNSIASLNFVKQSDFVVVSMALRHTTNACYNRWQAHILPIIKSHLLGLPQGVDWMKEFLMYVVKNEVTDVKKIEYNLLVEEIFHGQTSYSLRNFANSVRSTTVNQKRVRSNDPIHQLSLRQLNEPSPNSSYLGNEKMADSKLKYAEDIIEIYKSLIP